MMLKLDSNGIFRYLLAKTMEAMTPMYPRKGASDGQLS